MPDAGTPILAFPSRSVTTEHLLQQLNALVYIQAGILYYLDNAAAILLLRMIVQISFIAQRPPAPSSPQIAPVALTTLFCLIYHVFIFSSDPDNENPYKYSHGGVLVDFVGEPGPVSRGRIVFIDCLVFLIQLAILAITFEYGKLQGKKEENRQDLESEEQGTRRSQEGQDIELRDLSPNTNRDTTVGSHPSDIFYTDYTAIELDIVASLQDLARSTAASTAIDPENGAVSAVLNSVVARMVQRP
jgi:hypothetical protein